MKNSNIIFRMMVTMISHREKHRIYRYVRDELVCRPYQCARYAIRAPFDFNDHTYRESAMTATTMTMPGSSDGKQRSFPDKRLRIGSWKFIEASCTRAKINRPIANANYLAIVIYWYANWYSPNICENLYTACFRDAREHLSIDSYVASERILLRVFFIIEFLSVYL